MSTTGTDRDPLEAELESLRPAELPPALVARVAGREGWGDLSAPPEAHGPRTLDEGLAVARFTAAIPGARASRVRRTSEVTGAPVSVATLSLPTT